MDNYDFTPPTEKEKKDFESNYDFSPPTEEEKARLLSPKEEPSTLSDIATGTLQGLSFGWSDEAIAAAKALSAALTEKDKGLSDYSELYRKYKDIEQKKIEEGQDNDH